MAEGPDNLPIFDPFKPDRKALAVFKLVTMVQVEHTEGTEPANASQLVTRGAGSLLVCVCGMFSLQSSQTQVGARENKLLPLQNNIRTVLNPGSSPAKVCQAFQVSQNASEYLNFAIVSAPGVLTNRKK